MMQSSHFASFILVIFVAYSQTYFFFKDYFSGSDKIAAQNKHLSREIRRVEMEKTLLLADFDEFKQDTAVLIPESVEKNKDNQKRYQLRTLASVVVPSSPLEFERGSTLFEQGKTRFREQLYEEASVAFEKLLSQHPFSMHALEARFLLAEARFQMKDYENSLNVIEDMITLYPEHVLTGFAMLRLGQVLEVQDRMEDAVEVYKTVERSFQDDQLKTQAAKSLKEIEI